MRSSGAEQKNTERANREQEDQDVTQRCAALRLFYGFVIRGHALSLGIRREKGMKSTFESYKQRINKNGGQSSSQTKFDL
jgi:hypothetical protein